ncbi:unnamed protein product [Debaryomyces fabryi]|nr:unnamed protein product [Debaryomyces fabryi]
MIHMSQSENSAG